MDDTELEKVTISDGTPYHNVISQAKSIEIHVLGMAKEKKITFVQTLSTRFSQTFEI